MGRAGSWISSHVEGSIEENDAALRNAARTGNIPQLERLVGRVNLGSQDKSGFTALILAAYEGHPNAVKILVEAGVALEAKDKEGVTALIWAARNGHVLVVQRLLKAGASPDATDSDGLTPLITAAGAGRADILRLLLEAGAKLEAAPNEGDTALCRAVLYGNAKCVHVLIKAGASLVNPRDGVSYPLAYAHARSSHVSVVMLLLLLEGERCSVGIGAQSLERLLKLSSGTRGSASLMVAAFNGNAKEVRRLLEEGARPDAGDPEDVTPLIVAAATGHANVLRLLLQAGADLEAAIDEGETALMVAATCGNNQCVELLLGAGANIEATDYEGDTAVLRAALSSNVACAHTLVKAGARLHTPNGWSPLAGLSGMAREDTMSVRRTRGVRGDTAATANTQDCSRLLMAARSGSAKVVQRLLAEGTNPDAPDSEGATALIWAASSGHVQMAQLLLKAGANPNAADSGGVTALILAARSGYLQMVQLLLKGGATPNTADSQGMTALACAEKRGHDKIVSCLRAAPPQPKHEGSKRGSFWKNTFERVVGRFSRSSLALRPSSATPHARASPRPSRHSRPLFNAGALDVQPPSGRTDAPAASPAPLFKPWLCAAASWDSGLSADAPPPPPPRPVRAVHSVALGRRVYRSNKLDAKPPPRVALKRGQSLPDPPPTAGGFFDVRPPVGRADPLVTPNPLMLGRAIDPPRMYPSDDVAPPAGRRCSGFGGGAKPSFQGDIWTQRPAPRQFHNKARSPPPVRRQFPPLAHAVSPPHMRSPPSFTNATPHEEPKRQGTRPQVRSDASWIRRGAS